MQCKNTCIKCRETDIADEIKHGRGTWIKVCYKWDWQKHWPSVSKGSNWYLLFKSFNTWDLSLQEMKSESISSPKWKEHVPQKVHEERGKERQKKKKEHWRVSVRACLLLIVSSVIRNSLRMKAKSKCASEAHIVCIHTHTHAPPFHSWGRESLVSFASWAPTRSRLATY